MKTIGVIANCRKPDTPSALARLTAKAAAMGVSVLSCDETAGHAAGISRIAPEEMAQRCEAIVALGGDGTVLRAVRLLGGARVPVLGVNLGGLGFLTAVPEQDLERALEGLGAGRFRVSERTLLWARLVRERETVAEYQALNDVAVGWGASSRMVRLKVEVDGQELTTYACDGLVVSTPTGSTGHSLSAGGPIVHPEACVLVLCPICPHTLSHRPLILADHCTVTVAVVKSAKDLLLVSDGQEHATLRAGDVVEVRKSPQRACLVTLPDYDYFELVRQKLHWRGSTV